MKNPFEEAPKARAQYANHCHTSSDLAVMLLQGLYPLFKARLSIAFDSALNHKGAFIQSAQGFSNLRQSVICGILHLHKFLRI